MKLLHKLSFFVMLTWTAQRATVDLDYDVVWETSLREEIVEME